ncbi:MAG: DUF234 domain-containing protein [Sulfurospirillaceae bacterium]|nr:DUF234 domain-containing protein [Sulfurospirillaceae bacterium]
MSKQHTILKQFRSFCFQNNAKDLEQAIEYFSVFGGTSWAVDMQKPLIELVENKLLKNYAYIHGDITKLTQSNKMSHALLSAIALGDSRINSSYKRMRISREDGDRALDVLLDSKLVEIEHSVERPMREEDDISEKLNFVQPFMRFWFAFISPFYKSIKEGNYKEVKERFANREQGFCEPIFCKLSQAFLVKSFQDDPVVEMGSYWDKNAQIDILAKTKSGKLIAGTCKYAKSKANKTEIAKLKEKCVLAELEPDMYVIFSKSGFTNELKSSKSESLKLFTLKSLKVLVDDVSEKDFIPCSGKKY